jgi:hypothetical protein
MSQNNKKNGNKIVNLIKTSFDVGAEGAASLIGSVFADSLVGQVLPGVTTAIFSYKQMRFEQNMEKFVQEVKKKEQEFNERLSKLEKANFERFKNNCFGIITDYVIDEVQKEKIEYIVNGLLKLSSYEKIQDDFVLMYYDTLRDLRLVDIAVLKSYYVGTEGEQEKILKEFDLEYEQYMLTSAKLSRMGLLISDRDKELDNLFEDVNMLQEQLQSMQGGMRRIGYSAMRTFKPIGSYSITQFGRDFIEFFVENKK